MLLEFLLPYLMTGCLILFMLSLWKYYVNSLGDADSSLPLPPGTVGFPFIGETPYLAVKGFNFYREKRNKYGRIYKTHILGKPMIRVWGSENISKILKSEESLVTMSWPTSVVELIGPNGLLNSTRRLHNTRRAAFLKAFTSTAIADYAPGIEQLITLRLKSWCHKGKIMALKECQQLVFEVTARILLGCAFTQHQMETLLLNFKIIVENFFTLPLDVPGFGFYKAKRARAVVLSVLDDIIRQKDTNKTSPDALSILKKQVDDGSLTMAEVKDSLIELLFSAYNGLPSLCCSALTSLYHHPEVRETLLNEMESAELLAGDDAELSMSKLNQLPYLQQIRKELLRHSPPMGGGFRQVIKTFELEGYQIPKGWTVLYSIRDNHEMEFADATSFKPERWQDGKADDAFIPFGGNGIRSCVGVNYVTSFIQIFICQLTRSCSWQLEDPNTKFTYFPVQLPTNGLPIRIDAGDFKLKSE